MKKGFTLIELLAVIVILAIIALIATPIVLNIINDTKESASLRCAEMYLDGVEQTIARKSMNGTFNPNTCAINENGNLLCDGDTNEAIVEVDGEKPTSGYISFENGKIKNINLKFSDNKTIVKNEEGKFTYQKEKKFADICTYDETSEVAEKTEGAKYQCKVDPNKDAYTFYVLTTPTVDDTSIDLIMNRNIDRDGSPVYLASVVSWNSESGQRTSLYGPVTAMTFLYSATSSWTNVPPLTYTYTDRYSFVSNNGILTLEGTTNTTIGTLDIPLRSRLPILSELASKTEKTYLYSNISRGMMSGEMSPDGYWSLTSSSDSNARGIGYYNPDESGLTYNFIGIVGAGSVNGSRVSSSYYVGVRPVITIKL